MVINALSLLRLTRLYQSLISRFTSVRALKSHSHLENMTRRNKNKGWTGPKASASNAGSKRSASSAGPKPSASNGIKTNPPPKTVNLVVLGTGGPGTSHSLLLTTEYKRYMFNCGEGTQRLVAMNSELRVAAHAKLTGLEHIFITHKSWDNLGGLLGLSMTLEGVLNQSSKNITSKDKKDESPEASICIHGPRGVEKSIFMAKKFAVSANIRIVKSSERFSDESVDIHHVAFYRSENGAEPDSCSDSSSSSSDKGEPDAKRQKTKRRKIKETSVAYAYICQPKPVPGKINVEKCLDAGITIGPMVGQLQRGSAVILEDGTVVTPEQVMDVVDSEKRPILVVECPSLDFLPSLRDCMDARMKQAGDKSFILVAHMSPVEVYNSEPYQDWLKCFSSSTNHLVLNHSAAEADLIRVRTHQAMLNLVSPDIFPELPAAVGVRGVDSSEMRANGSHSTIDQGQTVFASPGVHYTYRGNEVGFHWANDVFDWKEVQEESLLIPGLSQELKALATFDGASKRKQFTPDDESDSTSQHKDDNDEGTDTENIRHYPKVTFLGTGSSEPNKIRAQSCIVVQLSKHTVIILDCGEDSYGQLHRFYGMEKAKRILCKLKAVFISHHHGDHHLGLFSLLKERELAFKSRGIKFYPVFLMAPVQMSRWLRFYHQDLEHIHHLFRFVKHQDDMEPYFDDVKYSRASVHDMKAELNLEEYKPVIVEHCPNAFGVVLQYNGYKMVYSGDTKPCDALVEAGTNCDLLIHEATHEDALIAHAKASKHSTFSQAMDIGKRMNAKHIILTHFSQRYPHMVPFFDIVLPQNVGVAFDNMQVSPATLHQLPSLIQPLTTMFADKMQRLEIRRIKMNRERAEKEGNSEDEAVL